MRGGVMREKLYHIDYYKQVGRDIVYAVLREDNWYAFFYLPENGSWELSSINFNFLKKDFEYVQIEKDIAIDFANNKPVDQFFTKMFGFKIARED